jgi:glycosyltransferase involved in cell wall biosynthesis
MRIACCSNYSLAEAGRLYLDGRYPRQGLYGAAGLAKRRSRVQPVRKARADRLLPDSARDRPTATSIGKSGRDRGGHSARSDRCRLKDALAMGKPVVITKSPHIDVDVEAIGCGFTVALGDVDGWTDALEKLRDPAVATAAGSRGRAWAERHWNADVCDAQVAAHIARTFRPSS